MLLLLAIHVLLFGLSSTVQSAFPHLKCPPQFNRSPCRCKTKTEGLDITCRQADMSQIRQALKGVTQPISYLKLNNNNLGVLPDRMFPDINVSHITMGRCSITKISPNAFQGLERKLKNLDLSTNQMNSVPTESLQNLRSLVSLNLGFNQFTTVGDEAFFGLESLENLYLYSNRIEQVSTGAFSGLGATLKFLNLGGNRLTAIPESALKSLKVLRTLKLHENQIREVDDDAFDGLEATLDSLDLDKNHFGRVPAAAISKLKVLKSLNIRDNAIPHINKDDFRGVEDTLEILELGQNQITEVPIQAIQIMANLHTLGFQKNKITYIPNNAFRGVGKTLKYLHLEENLISDIGLQAFRGLTLIGWLHLAMNQISRLPLDAFRDLDKTLQVLDIRGNPLVCDCGLQWIKTWNSNSKNTLVQNPLETTCFEPESVSGTPILDVKYEEFHCEDETKMEKDDEDHLTADDDLYDRENKDTRHPDQHIKVTGDGTDSVTVESVIDPPDEIHEPGKDNDKTHYNATSSEVARNTNSAATYRTFLHLSFLVLLPYVNYISESLQLL